MWSILYRSRAGLWQSRDIELPIQPLNELWPILEPPVELLHSFSAFRCVLLSLSPTGLQKVVDQPLFIYQADQSESSKVLSGHIGVVSYSMNDILGDSVSQPCVGASYTLVRVVFHREPIVKPVYHNGHNTTVKAPQGSFIEVNQNILPHTGHVR